MLKPSDLIVPAYRSAPYLKVLHCLSLRGIEITGKGWIDRMEKAIEVLGIDAVEAGITKSGDGNQLMDELARKR